MKILEVATQVICVHIGQAEGWAVNIDRGLELNL